MKNIQAKSVLVKEDRRTSLNEAGIFDLKVPDGSRIVALGYCFFPNHDRQLVELARKYIEESGASTVFLLGGILDEEAFKQLDPGDSLDLRDDNEEQPEVRRARAHFNFESRVIALGRICGEFVKELAPAAQTYYIPSTTHVSLGNEVRIIEWIHETKNRLTEVKRKLHRQILRKPELEKSLSMPQIDTTIHLSDTLAEILQLDQEERIRIMHYGSAVRVNERTLFMIGDFKRRHPGTAAYAEWEQRSCNIVRSFDGKCSSGWMTTANHTFPVLEQKHHEFHEVGHLWDVRKLGQYRDYERRMQGFWTGTVVGGELFGQSIPILRGKSGRRGFVVDGKSYQEENVTETVRRL